MSLISNGKEWFTKGLSSVSDPSAKKLASHAANSADGVRATEAIMNLHLRVDTE